MKRTGEILLFNTSVAPALNVYGQSVVPTGLVAGGDDALLLLGAQMEFGTVPDGQGRREVVLSRASKLAIPPLTDDDIMVKHVNMNLFVTSGAYLCDLAPQFLMPPQSIVVVEANFYLQFKTTGQTTNYSCSCLAWFERVVLTPNEKNSILSQRLNNLLN